MSDPIRRLTDRILNLFGYVRLSVIDDTGPQQLAQWQIKAGAGDGIAEIGDGAPRLAEYGFFSCPPDGSEAVVVFLGGRRSQGVIVATGHRATRPKDMKPGEAMMANTLQGQFIKASQDGKLRSQAPDWLHAGDIHLTGTYYATHLIPADGASGTFTTEDGKTVTVTNGIITAIV